MVRFTPRQVLKRQMVALPVIGLIAILTVWIYWKLQGQFASRIGSDGLSGNQRCVFAIAFTFLVPIWLTFQLFKTSALISRGRMAEARFVKFGSMTTKRRQKVTFEYLVNGQTYSRTQSVSVSVAEQFTTSMMVPVIYDVAKPSCAQIFPRHHVQIDLSDRTLRTLRESLAEDVREEISKIVAATLVLGQWSLAIFVLHRINDGYDVEVFGPACLGVIAIFMIEINLYDRWRRRRTPAYSARMAFPNRLIVPMAIVSVVWTGWAIQRESAQIKSDRENTAQADKDRETADRRERDFTASMRTFPRAVDPRNPAAPTTQR